MGLSIIRFDMRAPAFSSASPRDLYAAALDMAAWADEHDFVTITVSEHHGTEDGYLPSPLVMAGVLAGRTRRIGISVMALLVPLGDPLRLAEEIAVLDLASGGRLAVCAGLGYRPEEYAAAGRDFARRGKLLDEALHKMLCAWSDEPVEHNGVKVDVTPKPLTKPHPLLLVGGGSRAAARRAARFGLPFAPQIDDPALFDLYESECRRLGVTNGFVVRPGDGAMTFVSEDPDRTWREIGRHWLHDAKTYAAWARHGVPSAVTSKAQTVDELRSEGKYRVLTPEQCVATAKERGPAATFVHFPLAGGTPPELAWRSLELYASDVLPHIE